VVRQQPTDSASWRMLGMCHIAAGDCHEAVCASLMGRLHTPLPPSTSPSYALFVLGQTDEAAPSRACLRLRALQAPRPSPCAGGCAQVAAFRQCVALDPMCVEAWTYLGQTFKELALWQDAIKTFEHVLTVDPSCTSARRFFGILLHGLGRHRVSARRAPRPILLRS